MAYKERTRATDTLAVQIARGTTLRPRVVRYKECEIIDTRLIKRHTRCHVDSVAAICGKESSTQRAWEAIWNMGMELALKSYRLLTLSHSRFCQLTTHTGYCFRSMHPLICALSLDNIWILLAQRSIVFYNKFFKRVCGLRASKSGTPFLNYEFHCRR